MFPQLNCDGKQLWYVGNHKLDLWYGQLCKLKSDYALTNQTLAFYLDEDLEQHGVFCSSVLFNRIHTDYLQLTLVNMNERVYEIYPQQVIGVLKKL